ncbi:MAG TPA: hypothetical protein VJ810_35060 [Blastocatellia bacterium]|nr:hypothetical protein [Blastocatellia bacterium]
MISLRNSVTARTLTLTALLLSLGGLTALTAPMWQDDEQDVERRLWNKKFLAARAKAKSPSGTSPTQSQPPAATTQPPAQSQPAQPREQPGVPVAEGDEAPAEQLIGITFWRLREATARDLNGEKRLLLQQKYIAGRVAAETTFKRDDLVRLSIEAPRANGAYLYVIDRELYADGAIGSPHLILPSRTVRNGDHEVGVGKVLDLPASTDNIPYFSFSSDRADYAGEQLTIIISPRPLNLPRSEGAPAPLNQEQVEQLRNWERDWSGVVERREAKSQLGAKRTVVERDASEGERLLTQRDPLPQTIYRVKTQPANPGGYLLITVPLRIAQ